ncbi:MAG TPA: efflux RND transporter permease subunit [Polyangiales bacterium]
MSLVAGLRQRASLVWLLTLCAIAFGVVSLYGLPSGIHPEVEFPRVVVVVHVGDLPPEVVETLATRPLEEAIATLPYLRRVRSRTIRGAAELGISLEPGFDTWRALQLVQSKVAEVRADLPANATVIVERVAPTALPILTLNVDGSDDPRVLREIAARIVRPALTRVPGVGKVEVQGGDVREIEVVLRPEALAAAHVSPAALADHLAQSDFVAAVGRAREEHQVLTVLAASERTTPESIGALPIAMGPNGPVLLSSVADVFVGAEDRTIEVDAPTGDAAVIMLSRTPTASAPVVIHGVQAVLAQLRASHTLPPGIRVRAVYDQSQLIDEAMAGVRDAILLGVVLSLVVLALFLRDLRAGAAAALAVPVTLLCTFGVMRLCGQTLNLMSLGGLAVAIGLVVDDAIVIVEGIVQHLEHGRDVAEAAEQGTQELLAPVIGTTLTTVVVFAPLPLISGVVGSFFGALAVTLCAAVLLSLLVSITIVPLSAIGLLSRRPARAAQHSALARGYGRLVRGVMRQRVASIACVLVFAALGVLAATRVAVGFLPSMDEGAFVLDFFLPPGTSLEETDRIATNLDKLIATTKGVTGFTRRTGTEMGPATATQQNRGDFLVRLSPRRARSSIFEIMDEVRERAGKEVPEARVELIQVLQDVIDDLSGAPRPVEVKIFGQDSKRLTQLAHAAAKRISDLPELMDFWDGVDGDVPTLRADVDPVAAARLRVTPQEVSDDLTVALAGRVATRVRVDNWSLGVRVRMPDQVRFDAGAIASMPIAVGSSSVPLSTLVTLSRAVGPSVIRHENLSPVVILEAGVAANADLGAVVGRVRQRLAGFALPTGYRIEVGGQYENALETQRALAFVLGLGSMLVLAILLVQLRSLGLALVVVAGAPLSMLGAIATLLATNTPLNASSLMGCVLLAGLVVKNGILLLERALEESKSTASFAEAIALAGERRIRPIVMTTAATIAGLLPLALGLGAGAELQRPLAIATIGGLTVSTLVSLFVVPALAASLPRRQ